MTRHRPLLCLAAAFALAACGGREEAAAPAPADQSVSRAPFAAVFQCGDARVRFSGEGEAASLEANGETYFLQQMVTASGAKYEDPDDPGTWIWNKGDKASVSIRGAMLRECDALDPGAAPAKDASMTQETFKARGNEPGWMLTIEDGALSLAWNYGEDELSAPAPAPEREGAVTRYSVPAENLSVTVTEAICNDDATGMPHPYRVSVDIRGTALKGCGGEPVSLLAGEWLVEDINNGGVIDNSHATLSFSDDGRLAGTGSCNSYSAPYTLTAESLSVGPAVATRKACAPALMNQEQKFFDSLAKTERFEIDETGALILLGADGARILARRTD